MPTTEGYPCPDCCPCTDISALCPSWPHWWSLPVSGFGADCSQWNATWLLDSCQPHAAGGGALPPFYDGCWIAYLPGTNLAAYVQLTHVLPNLNLGLSSYFQLVFHDAAGNETAYFLSNAQWTCCGSNTLKLGGALLGVTMVIRGAGYTTAPTVSFSGGGGTGAAGTANVSFGQVTGVTMTDLGTGYTTAPTVGFTGGGGTGATGLAVIAGATPACNNPPATVTVTPNDQCPCGCTACSSPGLPLSMHEEITVIQTGANATFPITYRSVQGLSGLWLGQVQQGGSLWVGGITCFTNGQLSIQAAVDTFQGSAFLTPQNGFQCPPALSWSGTIVLIDPNNGNQLPVTVVLTA